MQSLCYYLDLYKTSCRHVLYHASKVFFLNRKPGSTMSNPSDRQKGLNVSVEYSYPLLNSSGNEEPHSTYTDTVMRFWYPSSEATWATHNSAQITSPIKQLIQVFSWPQNYISLLNLLECISIHLVSHYGRTKYFLATSNLIIQADIYHLNQISNAFSGLCWSLL